MTRMRKKIHDVSPRDRLDRFSFILAFVLGVGGGVVLKFLSAQPLVAAGYSALILVLYAVAAWLGGRIRLEPETIGDNCYYLGFLFTLASLAFTLYQMADPSLNDGRAVQIPEVISGFGVALSSTIVGVFLRVLMMQLRPDFVAKDREVRADVNRAFADFKKNMSGILRQMKAFSVESTQQAAERDAELRKETDRFLKDHRAELLKSSKLFTAQLEKMTSAVAEETLSKVQASVLKSGEEAQRSIERSISEMSALKDQLRVQETTSFNEAQQRRAELLAETEEATKIVAEHNAVLQELTKAMREAAQAAVALNREVRPPSSLAPETTADTSKPSESSSFWSRG